MLTAEHRGGSVAQKHLLLYCHCAITAGLMRMQIPAKVASHCDGVSGESFAQAASSTAVRRKTRCLRPLLNTQMLVPDKILFTMTCVYLKL